MATELDVDAASVPGRDATTRSGQAVARAALLLPLGAALELAERREADEHEHPLAVAPDGCRWGGSSFHRGATHRSERN